MVGLGLLNHPAQQPEPRRDFRSPLWLLGCTICALIYVRQQRREVANIEALLHNFDADGA